MVQKLLEELRNFGREPKQIWKPATPAQEHERLLAKKFNWHRDKLSSSQIQELKAIWASNSGDKHPVVAMEPWPMVVLKAGGESRGNAKKVMQNQTAVVNTLL